MKTNNFSINLSRAFLLFLATLLAGLAFSAPARGEFAPLWTSRVPAGTSLGSGTAGFHVDPDGISYVTGIVGSSSVNDIQTTSFEADGSTRWSVTYDSGKSGDQARGLARGPDNLLYVVGNTPGPNDFANVLVLVYDVTNGALLKTIKYSSGPGLSEYGAGVVGDAAGNIYVIGGTVGDGPDVMTVKFNSAGVVQWRKVWDGTAFPPLDQDAPVKILLDSADNVLSCITGYMAGGHPDYVVVKYAPLNGAKLWEATFGVTGGDFPADMEIDAADDVYVTGIGIDFIDKYSTVKFRGTDGQLLWQFYDSLGNDHSASGLFLDGVGGVFVTGASDPEGDHSNFNDDFFTVKRDATTGALLWTHTYGDRVSAATTCRRMCGLIRMGTSSSSARRVRRLTVTTCSCLCWIPPPGWKKIAGSSSTRVWRFRLQARCVSTPLSIFLTGGAIYNANTGAIDMSVTKWASLVAAGGGIPCEDLRSFQARCKVTSRGHNLQAQLTLTDTSHAGNR
jgi:hypothetical protein